MNELTCVKQIIEAACYAVSIGANKTARELVKLSIDMLGELEFTGWTKLKEQK